MSMRTILVIFLAIVFGGSAAVGVNSFRLPGAPAAQVETVPVVVAAVDVPRSVLVTPELLKTRDWPKNLLPPGTMTKPEEAVGRVALAPLAKDGPVLDGHLAPKGAGRGLAALVPPGMRGYTMLTPNIVSGVAGFVLPGNKVDVLLTMTDVSATITLLQNMEILAVDQRLDAPADNKVDPNQLRCVTLLVTPDQAARLDLAQTKGTLHLSLRNLGDGDSAKTRPATAADLRVEEKPWEAPAEPPVRVRTIRGGQEGAVYVLQPGRTPEAAAAGR